MSSLPPPPEHLTDRAFATGEHVGEPWCGTAYCPVCVHEEVAAGLEQADEDDDAKPTRPAP